MIKLVDSPTEQIYRGSVLRFPATHPYEKFVDFMVFEQHQDNTRGMGLIVTSGYKAGLISIVLPSESGKTSVDKAWLIANWNKWVYPDCNVEDVYLIDCYKI
ncbi:Imm45 family immunity protein [Vibrio ruber]|uniref:Imm45 family immunity protein n=1 Tax=Vibrio ruber TaxID=184755 RepID=UPI002892D752|nr:Imm45 family immunity protein [Vibrio ruber]WNJ95686.1 Imm45 family immunity protein [Vibrio ruber]